jgi:arylsulfatase A-like enzyme
MAERLRFIAEISLVTGIVFSIFEGIYYYLSFPISNLSGLCEMTFKNLVVFLIIGLAGYLFVTIIPQNIRNRLPDLIPVVLSLLISFPVFFFLLYILEWTTVIYRIVNDPKVVVLIITVPILLLILMLSYPLRDQLRGRFTGIVFSVYFLINPGQHYVDWNSLTRGEFRGALTLVIALLVTAAIYLATMKFQARFLQSDLLLNYRPGLRKLVVLMVILSIFPIFRSRMMATERAISLESVDRPNILLIVLDTARADRLSCYNYERDTTPFLASFSEGATLYPNAISPAPWTLPSHASIFTGLYPSAHGTTWKKTFLGDHFVTLPEILSENGYVTVGFCNNPAVGDVSGLDQGFEQYVEVWRDNIMNPTLFYRIEWFFRRFLGRNDGGALRTNAYIAEWFDRIYLGGRPFFLFINWMECHLWYDAPDRYHEKYLEGNLSPAIEKLNSSDLYPILTGYASLTDREWRDYGGIYDGDIHYLDRRLEDLIRFLEKEDYLDDTIVVITSDHGEHLGEHGMIDHMMSLYEPLLRVPLIIRVPEGSPELPRTDRTVQTVDIYPTILSLIGLDEYEDRQQIQGVSLIGEKADTRGMILAEHEPPVERILAFLEDYPEATEILRYDRSLKSIQVGTFKYIWGSKGEPELYDLSNDPGELVNLLDRRKEVANDMERRLMAWLSSFEHASVEEGATELDREVRQRLKALGYID